MNKNYLIIGLIILALIVIGVIAARPSDEPVVNDETNKQEETAAVPSIEVSNQTVVNDSVLVDSVYSENPGLVVVYGTTDQGDLDVDSVIGVIAVKAGESKNVVVPLTKEVKNGEVLIAMLHEDTGVIGEYEFSSETPDVDKPVVVDGETVFRIFTVSTDEAAPAEDSGESTGDSTPTNTSTEAGAEAETNVTQ